MIISKKRFTKLFYNYSLAIYQEAGRKLGANQQRILKNKIDKLYKQNTIKSLIKSKIKSFNEWKKQKHYSGTITTGGLKNGIRKH